MRACCIVWWLLARARRVLSIVCHQAWIAQGRSQLAGIQCACQAVNLACCQCPQVVWQDVQEAGHLLMIQRVELVYTIWFCLGAPLCTYLHHVCVLGFWCDQAEACSHGWCGRLTVKLEA